jgi:hypothetical protein
MISALISAADEFAVLAISQWVILWPKRSRFLLDKLKSWHAMLAISATLSASVALAEDFKTTNGKVYKDATVSRVEADGIELKTKTGISKVYFTELPQDVQERFHWAKPDVPREPFYSRWAAAAEDPAVLAKIIAAGTVVIAGVGLVIGHIRSRRRPTMRARRTSRRKAIHRAR